MENDEKNKIVEILNANFDEIDPSFDANRKHTTNVWRKKHTNIYVYLQQSKGHFTFDCYRALDTGYKKEWVCNIYTPDDIKAIITLIR